MNSIDAKKKRSWDLYSNQVLSYLRAPVGVKKKIREDLHHSLEERWMLGDDRTPEEILGNPRDVSAEFAENLGLDNSVYTGGEYISKIRIFGLPLVHIVKAERSTLGDGTPIAKGVIAVGPVPIGIFAAGGVSVGAFSLGGVSLGLITAFGGLSLAGLLAFGGLAISIFAAIGGMAISGIFSVGALSVSFGIAVGALPIGQIVGYEDELPTSDYIRYAFRFPREAHRFIRAVETEFAWLPDFMLKFIRFFTKTG